MKTQTVDEFTRDMEALADMFAQDQTAALSDCSEIILEGVRLNFDTSKAADGTLWPPRKDPRPTHPLLILEGDLKVAAIYGNINRIVNGNELQVGVSKDVIPYAGVHQYGYPEKNIAQREYLAMSNATIEQCQEIIADYACVEFS